MRPVAPLSDLLQESTLNAGFAIGSRAYRLMIR